MKNKFDCERLVSDYSNMIYKIAKNYLRNSTDAEDIVQEVLIKYIDNDKPFKDIEHEKRWIIRVTINLCINELKSARNKKNVLTNEFDISKEYFSDEEKLYHYLDILDEKYKVLFELYYFHDIKIREISKILNITEVSARTRLKRARNRIKKYIEEEENFDEQYR